MLQLNQRAHEELLGAWDKRRGAMAKRSIRVEVIVLAASALLIAFVACAGSAAISTAFGPTR